MKEIEISNGYTYLPDHNMLLNNETLEKYRSHLQAIQVKLPDPLITTGFP